MAARKKDDFRLADAPLWYKDAIIYELHVKSFYDSSGDGIGDFRGLIEKLGYIENLGVTAIWLLPFYPSPLKDDGYDISSYFRVHPDYGTLRDFESFLNEAHRRGIRIIIEIVLNHTSDQHVWFQKARRARPSSALRNFYVWSNTPEKYKDARIIFKDFETSNWAWDPVAKAYYWHRFYTHQPDLNYDSPHVQKAVLRVLDYWLDRGVDGLRLDAAPYLFEREGTNCENLAETHGFLKKLREHIDAKYKDIMLLAESNQWPEDAAAYFGSGDECHMAFHFPLMPRMFMASWMEDSFPIIDVFEQTPSIPENCQWALFLRNHDELTLEMVSDEERDYMYRVYARDPTARINLGIRRRLAPLLGNDRKRIELMTVLLFSLPGTPVIYYGDEIGMGDNYYLGDRDGVRTPMQWTADRNAGFSQVNPQRLHPPVIIDPDYRYEAINVETLERNRASLLWWMRRLIAIRKRLKSFSRGGIEFLRPDNTKVLAFIREYEDENILVVANLSRFPQAVELDLSRFSGYLAEEVLSRNRFPSIKHSPYVLTLGSHDYYWLLLRKEEETLIIEGRQVLPELSVKGSWETVFQGSTKAKLERGALPRYLKECRWFRSKTRKVRQVKIKEDIAIRGKDSATHLLLLETQYYDETTEMYVLPVSFSSGDKSQKIMEEYPLGVVARLKGDRTEGIIYDGVYDEEFRQNILRLMFKRRRIGRLQGQLIAYPGRFLKGKEHELASGKSEVLKGEQSNTSLLYEGALIFKLFRIADEGINPDLEMNRFLTERAFFPNVAPFAGAIEYRRPASEPIVIGMLNAFVPNQGDAWTYTLDLLGRYFERALAKRSEIQEIPEVSGSPLAMAFQEVPPLFEELIGGVFLNMASVLGRRTAELHLALSSITEEPDFEPEPFSILYQRSLYQSMRGLTMNVFELLDRDLRNLPDDLKQEASEVLSLKKDIMQRFSAIFQRKISSMKIRIHGDYHLGQLLYTGNDFVIIDFEGEPARALSERRLKRSPIQDVASMIRSFHYAAYTSLNLLLKEITPSPEISQWLAVSAALWYKYVAGVFLKSYLDTAGDTPLIPKDKEELDILLRAFLLEKAVYELGYELNNRPDWVKVPIQGILQLMGC